MSPVATNRVALGLGLLWAAAGCALFSPNREVYETIRANPHHKTGLARKLNDQAIGQLDDGNPSLAMTTLNRALIADVTFGPAHNNLGRIHFEEGDFYLAAWEFEYAARLMPNNPEPINNLGLVYETAGRLAEACVQYAAACDLAPDHPEFRGNLVRAKLRQGCVDDTVIEGLREIVLKDPRDDWREWAEELLHTRYKDWPVGAFEIVPFLPPPKAPIPPESDPVSEPPPPMLAPPPGSSEAPSSDPASDPESFFPNFPGNAE